MEAFQVLVMWYNLDLDTDFPSNQKVSLDKFYLIAWCVFNGLND